MALRRGWAHADDPLAVVMSAVICVIEALLSGVCLLVMVAIVRRDLAERLIPRGLCWALAITGVALQLIVGGQEAVIAGICWAIASCVATLACAWLVGKRGGDNVSPIGGGDIRCMIALSLATGTAAPVGFAACFASAALWAGIARLRYRLLPGEPFAFAPFLMIWLVGGLICSLLA